MTRYEDIEIGQTASISRVFTLADLEVFGKLSLDTNPIHFDESYAEKTVFGKRIVHGFLYASLISGIFGTDFPGNGTVFLSQEMHFLRPVYIDDKVTATVKVIAKEDKKRIVTFETICIKNDKKVVLKGVATVTC
jgi:acyl dehydratase